LADLLTIYMFLSQEDASYPSDEIPEPDKHK
jgi:hypothetical protein